MAHDMHAVNIYVKNKYAPRNLENTQPSSHNADMNISKLRKLRGWNQTQLAEMTNLTQPTISRAENCKDSSTLGDLKSIAEALNVPLYELFITDRSELELELLRIFRQLPKERQRGWIDMANLASRDPQQSDQ